MDIKHLAFLMLIVTAFYVDNTMSCDHHNCYIRCTELYAIDFPVARCDGHTCNCYKTNGQWISGFTL